MQNQICIDLNGVWDTYSGWQGSVTWHPPRPGAAQFLRKPDGITPHWSNRAEPGSRRVRRRFELRTWGRKHPFDEDYVRSVLELLPNTYSARTESIRITLEHSNDLASVRVDGRLLVIKRARYAAMAGRFLTDEAAARLIRQHDGVLCPDYRVIEDAYGEPILVYFWLPNPTLAELWPQIPDPERPNVMQGWGQLIRRLHDIRLPGYGALLTARELPEPLAAFLHADLEVRLRPAIAASWPDGLRTLDRLIAAAPRIIERVDPAGGSLLHADLFAANVLCDREDNRVQCVGFLDFENAFSGPPEADLAKTEILHGPLFGEAWTGGWFEQLLEGYGRQPDPLLLGYFRAYHLLNMGYYAAVTNLRVHAREVATAAEIEANTLGSARRHRDLLSSIPLNH